MNIPVFSLVVLVGAALFVNGYDVSKILQKIPENEKPAFIRHHVMMGYELATAPSQNHSKTDLGEINLPPNFSVLLYETVIKHHTITDESLLRFLRNVICFPNGQCIDIGDVGVHPYGKDKLP